MYRLLVQAANVSILAQKTSENFMYFKSADIMKYLFKNKSPYIKLFFLALLPSGNVYGMNLILVRLPSKLFLISKQRISCVIPANLDTPHI